MGLPSVGAVVVIPFPFSDLSQSKLRPAVVLAAVGRDDWIVCQVTSNPYSDPRAVPIGQGDFADGGLRVASFARPGRLITIHRTLIHSRVGALRISTLDRIIGACVALLKSHPSSP